MATAILDILDPDVWLVIDRWAARAVFGKVTSRYSAIRYRGVRQALGDRGPRCWGADLSIHELDVKAQSASRNRDLPAGWRTIAMPPFRSSASAPTSSAALTHGT